MKTKMESPKKVTENAGEKILERAAMNTLLFRHFKLPQIYEILQTDTDLISSQTSGETLPQVTEVLARDDAKKRKQHEPF